MLHRMPKPGDLIQSENEAARCLLVLYSWNETIVRIRKNKDDSRCFIEHLTPDGKKDNTVVYYDSWVFLNDPDVYNITNNISEE